MNTAQTTINMLSTHRPIPRVSDHPRLPDPWFLQAANPAPFGSCRHWPPAREPYYETKGHGFEPYQSDLTMPFLQHCWTALRLSVLHLEDLIVLVHSFTHSDADLVALFRLGHGQVFNLDRQPGRSRSSGPLRGG